MRKLFSLALLLTLLVQSSPREASAADRAQIQSAINRGSAFLKSRIVQSPPGYYSLAGYALLKAEVSPEAAQIPLIANKIRGKILGGVYRPKEHHVYEAAVDLLVLEAADSETYFSEIQAALNYLISKQSPSGSWFYPDRHDTGGDSSITQYAILALWAAARAGFNVPADTWSGAAAWFIATQRSDGGHVYHPGATGQPTYLIARHSLAAAGASSLLIASMHLYGEDDTQIAAHRGKRFGVLEPVGGKAASSRATGASVSRPEMQAAAKRAIDWLDANFTFAPNRSTYYYLYGLERTGALAGVEEFGGRDWYRDGSTVIVNSQLPTGGWADRRAPERTVADTSFALLFLSKATAQLLQSDPPNLFGMGLLAGGRGLPTDLAAVEVNNGKVETRRLAGDIDDVLLELENPKSIQVESAQAALVEQLQFGDREQLVGQAERLKKLVSDPRPEVRRTAVWALGRTGDLSLAGMMVELLQDDDIDVLVEARNALCWISRRPRGVGMPGNPLSGLPEDADAQRRQTAVRRWKAEAIARWQAWLLEIRPYDQRNDLMEVETRR